jgi:hypothetical protein
MRKRSWKAFFQPFAVFGFAEEWLRGFHVA